MKDKDRLPHCPLCAANGNLFRVLPEYSRAHYYRCSGCGIIWLAKDAWPEHLETHYSTVYYTDTYTGRPGAFPSFAYRLPLIESCIPAGGKVLEVGAASGEFLYLLKSKGYDVIGVELSAAAVAAGRARYGLDLRQGTLRDADLSPGSVDAVVLFHVLEHVPDPAALLTDIFQVLKPGGCVLIEVPDPSSVDAVLSPRLMRSVLDFPHHLFSFTPSCLRAFLVRAGFNVFHKESSAPYVLTSFFKKSIPHGNKSLKSTSVETSAIGVDSVVIESNFKIRLRRMFGACIPGMKLTFVARKP